MTVTAGSTAQHATISSTVLARIGGYRAPQPRSSTACNGSTTPKSAWESSANR